MVVTSCKIIVFVLIFFCDDFTQLSFASVPVESFQFISAVMRDVDFVLNHVIIIAYTEYSHNTVVINML